MIDVALPLGVSKRHARVGGGSVGREETPQEEGVTPGRCGSASVSMCCVVGSLSSYFTIVYLFGVRSAMGRGGSDARR